VVNTTAQKYTVGSRVGEFVRVIVQWDEVNSIQKMRVFISDSVDVELTRRRKGKLPFTECKALDTYAKTDADRRVES
jgi:DNA primase